MTLSIFRLLNDNLLEGRVPEELYSIGVHGGAIEYVLLVIFLASECHASCCKC